VEAGHKLWRYGLTTGAVRPNLLTDQKNACGMAVTFCGGESGWSPRSHLLPGEEDVCGSSFAGWPVGQHCAGAHRAEVEAGQRYLAHSPATRRVALADRRPGKDPAFAESRLRLGRRTGTREAAKDYALAWSGGLAA